MLLPLLLSMYAGMCARVGEGGECLECLAWNGGCVRLEGGRRCFEQGAGLGGWWEFERFGGGGGAFWEGAREALACHCLVSCHYFGIIFIVAVFIWDPHRELTDIQKLR